MRAFVNGGLRPGYYHASSTMSSHLAAVATLALAILLSPETLVAGLIIASDKVHPRMAAFAFAVGAIVGIAFSTGIGLLIADATGAEATTRHGTWPGFIVRAALALTLLVIGLSRARNAFERNPIPDVSEADHKPSKFATRLEQRIPSLARMVKPGADLTNGQRLTRGALAGFALCGLHPKIFPIAIAAGHQITQITDPAERTFGIVLFAAIAVVPALLPAVIEVVKPGASGRIKEGYERIMKVHGRWITAGLLLAAAALVGHNAWEKYPGRG